MKKLKLNKKVISTLTREEAKRVVGGGITDGCQTHIYEGCDPGGTWDNCSDACSDVCDTRPTCYCGTDLGATCNGCQTDYGCPADTVPYTECGTVC